MIAYECVEHLIANGVARADVSALGDPSGHPQPDQNRPLTDTPPGPMPTLTRCALSRDDGAAMNNTAAPTASTPPAT